MTNNLNRAYIKLGEAQMAVTTATDILKNHFTGFDRVVLERLVPDIQHLRDLTSNRIKNCE